MPTTLSTRQAARIAYMILREYRMATGDTGLPVWDDLSDTERRDYHRAAAVILAHPDVTPEQSHEDWRLRRRKEGWGWGPVYDPELKQHPDLMPWAELPERDRMRDVLMMGVVRCLREPIPPT